MQSPLESIAYYPPLGSAPPWRPLPPRGPVEQALQLMGQPPVRLEEPSREGTISGPRPIAPAEIRT